MPHDMPPVKTFCERLVRAFNAKAVHTDGRAYRLTIEPHTGGNLMLQDCREEELGSGFLLQIGPHLSPDGASFGLRNAFKMFDHGASPIRETKGGIWVAKRGMDMLEKTAETAGTEHTINLFLEGYKEGAAASVNYGIRMR